MIYLMIITTVKFKKLNASFIILGEHSSDGVKTESEPDLKTMLQKLKPCSGSPHRLTILRDNVFEDSVAFFKQRNFDFAVPIKVKFENEPAIDGGGPVREYFTLLTQSLLSSSTSVRLFEGRNSCFLPIHNTDALRSNLLKVAGRIVAASVCHGGPGFPVFSKGVYYYLQNPNTDDLSAYISKDDVIDIDVVEALQKVQQVYELLIMYILLISAYNCKF